MADEERPVVGETTEALYEALGVLTAGDEERDWPLLTFCEAICGQLLEKIDVYVRDRDEYPGWVIALDPDNAPAAALPFLGQFVGVELEPSLTELEQRDKIRLPEGFRRGTPAALEEAVKRTLIDSKTVIIEERYGDAAYQLRVRTFASETPDAQATEAAAVSQKPIGIVLDFEAITGMSWSDLEADYADWDEVEATFADWDEVRSTLP